MLGAVQVWCAAPLDPQQVDVVDVAQVGGLVEAVDLCQAAQLAFGDLADESVVEDEFPAEGGVGIETGERARPW
ncbi:hypothetical protein ACQF36_26190 [Streptomyces sp. Marseille-Q5077]|uniref:hypothetical protein n=1 Tax=Streptomyces TaxID=1883 RepID=UPI0033B5E27F